MTNLFKRIYIFNTGYSYTHMGRLFLRLFVGVMMMQFGLRQLYHFSASAANFPPTLGMGAETSMIVMTVLEILCSFCIMLGFCTRLMTLPLLVAMGIAEYHLISIADRASYMFTWEMPGYLPVMFMGIYFFILLVGPGKISVDYFLSLYFIHSENKSESELEEV